MSLSQQERFLNLLDTNAAAFTFQTFADNPSLKDHNELIQVFHADMHNPRLPHLHESGAGIYITVNETDGRGRKAENVTRVRAVWREADASDLPPLPLEPSLVVETSPGHCHEYFFISGDWPADENGRKDFDGVLDRMVASYRSDPGAKGINRVLRVPGFLNRKRDEPHPVKIVKETGRRYTRQEILKAFPPLPRAKPAERPFTPGNDDEARIRDALFRINADDRQIWLDCGMALKSHLGDSAGRALWDSWSQTSAKYTERDQDKTWQSFKKNGIGIGSVFHHARQAGWVSRRPNGHDHSAKQRPSDDDEFSADDLSRMEFEPIKYIVPGYIGEGLTLFAGKPKIGKSWLLMHVAWGVAANDYTLGGIKCEHGDVLYAALEDNKRRLKRRMRKLFGDVPWPKRLTFKCSMPRLAEGGIECIRKWIEKSACPRLVIVDTLAMVRTRNAKDQSVYDADYAAVKELRLRIRPRPIPSIRGSGSRLPAAPTLS